MTDDQNFLKITQGHDLDNICQDRGHRGVIRYCQVLPMVLSSIKTYAQKFIKFCTKINLSFSNITYNYITSRNI